MRRPSALSTRKSSITIALSSEPPRARPFERSISTSCVKPKVRARATSRTKRDLGEIDLDLELGASKHRMVELDREADLEAVERLGARTFLSPCASSTRLQHAHVALGAPPAPRSPPTAAGTRTCPALPSMIGTSSAGHVDVGVVDAQPAKRATSGARRSRRARRPSRCTVAIVVLVTLSACAGSAGCPAGRSGRRRCRCRSGAGRSAIVDLVAGVQAHPVARTAVFRVLWRSIRSNSAIRN